MAVYARGRITHFGARGQTQLVVYYMEPAGRGELELRMKKLLARLEKEGLLRAERKRAIPPYPEKIAVITSLSGAVIRDIRNTINRRWPLVKLVPLAADVQGATAASSIVQAFQKLDLMEGIDLVILARGGGGIEDLWTFNTEEVARAVSRSRYPVVTGIGHETDRTVCDYVSDVYGSTPTAAAEVATPSVVDVTERISVSVSRMRESVAKNENRRSDLVKYIMASGVFPSVTHRIERATFILEDRNETISGWWRWAEREKRGMIGERIDLIMKSAAELLAGSRERFNMAEASIAAKGPAASIGAYAQKTDKLVSMGRFASAKRVILEKEKLESKLRTLKSLNPMNVLKRGYAVCTSEENGGIVDGVDSVEIGKGLNVHFYRGRLICDVREKRGGSRWPGKS